MRVLITGGDGLVGWLFAKYFIQNNCTVKIIDDLSKRSELIKNNIRPLNDTGSIQDKVSYFEKQNKKVIFDNGSLLNHRFVYNSISTFQPEIIIHAAKSKSDYLSFKNREGAFHAMQNNTLGFTNLMFAIKHSRSSPLILLINDSNNFDFDGLKNISSFLKISSFNNFQQSNFFSKVWNLNIVNIFLGSLIGVESKSEGRNLISTEFYYDFILGNSVHNLLAQCLFKSHGQISSNMPEEFRILKVNKYEKWIDELFKKINLKTETKKILIFDRLVNRIDLEKSLRKKLKRKLEFNFSCKLKKSKINQDFSNEEIISSENKNNEDYLEEIINYLEAEKSKISVEFLDENKVNLSEKKKTKNNKIKKICFSTGKRGGFGAINPLLRLLKDDKEIELQLICTDMHLYDSFGKTMNEVSKYFEVTKVVDMAQMSDSRMERTRSLGRCITGMAEVLSDLNPDLVLLLGDRGETLATAFASVELGIPIAHIQAGDVSGGLDDIHRHAITKLSHIHFSQTEKQANRVKSLGEQSNRIFNVGSPYIDRIVKKQFTSNKKELKDKYSIDVSKPYLILLQHPDTYDPENSYQQTDRIFKSLSRYEFPVVVVYPCSDQGFQGVVNAIEKNRKPNYHIFYSIDSYDFLGLMNYAKLMIGNSSSGIIEAPYFKLPFVNVGNRQQNREKWINVIDVGFTKSEIDDGLKLGLSKSFRDKLQNLKPIFGKGSANEKIYKTLKDVVLNDAFFHKQVILNEN